PRKKVCRSAFSRKDRKTHTQPRLRTMTSNQAHPALRYIRKVAATERARTLSDQELLDLFITQHDATAFVLKAKSVSKLTIAIVVLLLSSVALAGEPSAQEGQGFKDMIKKYEWQDRLWKGAAFQTPYKENLSEDEKVAGLSFFWSQVKY